MAILSFIFCEDCRERREVMHSPADPKPKVCGGCRKARADNARAAHLGARAALPIEERLKLIEAWIYDYRPQYVEPPRF